jgi:hypothetical protein
LFCFFGWGKSGIVVQVYLAVLFNFADHKKDIKADIQQFDYNTLGREGNFYLHRTGAGPKT